MSIDAKINGTSVSYMRNEQTRAKFHLSRVVLRIKTSARVVDLFAALTALVRPGEVCDGDDEEAVMLRLAFVIIMHMMRMMYLFELSAIPASALYQARKAAMRPKAPPATIHPDCGCLPSFWRYPIPKSMKAMSRVKKREKNATVDRSVQMSRMKVKMNHPMRKRPNEFKNAASDFATSWVSMLTGAGMRTIAKEIQKPPYDERAVAPNVLPTAISLIILVSLDVLKQMQEAYVPHASEKLNKTAITKSERDDNVRSRNAPRVHVD